MTDQVTVSTPDPRLVALITVAAQIARTADPTDVSDDDGEHEAFVVRATDVRRLRRALKNLQ